MGVKIQLAISVWMMSLASLLGLSYVFMQPSAARFAIAHPRSCQTIVTDPLPPLNVRSSPIVAQDNIIGAVGNGTQLTVLREQGGWLHIQTPVRGWVATSMTTTTCPSQAQRLSVNSPRANSPRANSPRANSPRANSPRANSPRAATLRPVSLQIIEKAQQQFQAGQFQAAQTILQTIPASDFHYPQAQAARQTMTHLWQQGDRTYRTAQIASQQGRWQIVLSTVHEIPDIQYWRSKMAPIVKRAIHQQAQL